MPAKKSRSRSESSAAAAESTPASAPRERDERAEASLPVDAPEGGAERLDGWCLRVGLWGLLAWLVGGGALEALHAFKVPLYLQDHVRRELWTWAHAHGTLFSLASLVIAMLAPQLPLGFDARRWADRLFAAGAVALPLGFLFGGIAHPEGDPNLFILLVPAGGLSAAAALAILAIARETR